MSGGCAIYVGDNPMQQRTNPFGKDIANRGLFRALIEHGPWADQMFLVHNKLDGAALAAKLFGDRPAPKPLHSTSVMNQRAIAERGVLFRGQSRLSEIGWLRHSGGNDRAYSLVGLLHSLGPQAMRAYTAEAVSSPVEPWDAVICTSPAVERNLRAMLEETSDFLAARFAMPGAAHRRPLPQLPVIPLGVDAAAFAARRKGMGRGEARAALGVAEDAFVMLWLGRLSYFEKAYPQAMFAAAEETARRTGRPVEFLMAGWFPNPKRDPQAWDEAAALYAPNVTVRYLDGNDPAVLDRIWPASDVFVSLVDNIQETFGITPIEAMAAGLPVVVSDWDGYRYTVRHGVTGFRVPTLIAPDGSGGLIAGRHALGMDTYQQYVAQVAAHVAVNIRAAADALSALAVDPDLARRMGEAARRHARDSFDWPVVVAQYARLFDDLEALRGSAAPHAAEGAGHGNPVRGDPFGTFADFASESFGSDTVFRSAGPLSPADAARHHAAALNNVTAIWRLSPAATARICSLTAEHSGVTGSGIAAALGEVGHDFLARHLVWMCKIGLLDWRTPELPEVDLPRG